MKILGLDPGSRFTGFGLVEKRGSRLVPLSHGRIRLARSREHSWRLGELRARLAELLGRERPDLAVLEALYGGVNVRSLIALAQARGVILATVVEAGVDLCEYSPAEIKSAVTGNGRADKEQVGRMVRMILGLDPGVDLSSDAGDALAAAICGAQRLALDRVAGRGSRAGPRPATGPPERDSKH